MIAATLHAALARIVAARDASPADRIPADLTIAINAARLLADQPISEFDAFRPYRGQTANRRQEVVYWPEVDRRVEKAERRGADRVIREKKS